MNVIYFGYNSFKKFKRGVENVIIFQSLALNFKYRVYIHWGDKNEVYKYNNFICISIKVGCSYNTNKPIHWDVLIS